jgi:hypothetical protein
LILDRIDGVSDYGEDDEEEDYYDGDDVVAFYHDLFLSFSCLMEIGWVW